MYDRNAFHEFLWDHSDRLGFLKISQKEIANILELREATITSMMQDLAKANKIIKSKHRILVKDPSLTRWDNSAIFPGIKNTSQIKRR